MKKIIVDTSVIIAVIANEASKRKLIEITKDTELVAPVSLHFEIGNALSAMLKRKKINTDMIKKLVKYYSDIQITFVNPDLENSLNIASQLKIYAYDAYFLDCGLRLKLPILSLDRGLNMAAKKINLKTIEV